jgi:RimJ/RimL family protein N-acetyltransferase
MKLQLRKINFQDKDVLFRWANLRSVRKNSLIKKKISYENHIKWINKYLKNNSKNIAKLICVQKEPIGLVRIDKKNKDLFISYLIAPKFRKKGYATKAMRLFIKSFKKKKLVAIVKNENKASIKIFNNLSFKLILKTPKYHKFIYMFDNKKLKFN